MRAEQANRLARHPPVDAVDQPESLGRIEEDARRDDLPPLAQHPEQELVLRDAAVAQVEDRLRRQHEEILLERLLDPPLPVGAGDGGGLPAAVGFVEVDPVPAAFL